MERFSDLLCRSVLGQIILHARYLAQLDALMQRSLPAEMSPHCRLVNLKGDKLTIAADSSAWATRLRMSTLELLDTLSSLPEFSKVKQIVCCVRPSLTEQAELMGARHGEPPAVLAQKSIATIEACAAGVKDAKLRAALLRFAGRRGQGREEKV